MTESLASRKRKYNRVSPANQMAGITASERFATAIALLGGRLVGEYKKSSESVHCVCANDHDCYPIPNNIQQGRGVCRKCAGRCPEEAKTAFIAAIEAQGGRVIGEYIRSYEGVLCVCAEGHECYPAPNGIQQGRGMCVKCAGRCPEETERVFRASIAELNGRVVGVYNGSPEGVHCLCANGHDCYPAPADIRRGQGMCLKCVGTCPENSESEFRASISTQGGRVMGAYVRSVDKVHCICSKGHDCYPSPTCIQRGYGMCLKCTGCCPKESEQKFRASINQQGGRVLGEYIRSGEGIQCTCPNGHDCCPTPNYIREGYDMCTKCSPSSYGELRVSKALESLGIEFQVQYRFKPDRRRYDFCIEKDHVIIEFDGLQHFRVSQWLKTEEELLANQEIDRKKQALALSKGFRMMRFDFSWSRRSDVQIADKIRWFINESTDSLWLSEPQLYEWLFNQEAAQESSDLHPKEIEFPQSA